MSRTGNLIHCDWCDRPPTWHLAWKTPTMPAPAFAYACDEHRLEGMVPMGVPVIVWEHLPAPEASQNRPWRGGSSTEGVGLTP